jgi:hypothetical protein
MHNERLSAEPREKFHKAAEHAQVALEAMAALARKEKETIYRAVPDLPGTGETA